MSGLVYPPPAVKRRSGQIRFLLERKFPDLQNIKIYRARSLAPGRSSGRNPKLEQRSDELQAVEKQLSAMTQDELSALFDREHKAYCEEQQAQMDAVRHADEERLLEHERRMVWHLSEGDADISHWSRASLWSLDEATALSFGKEPRLVNMEVVRQALGYSEFAKQYAARYDLLCRAAQAGQLSAPEAPAKILRWLKRKGLDVPEALWTEVHRWTPIPKEVAKTLFPNLVSPFNQPEDPPRSSDTVTSEEVRELLCQKEALEQDVERLEKKIEFLQRQKRQSHPRVIESLQKLAIGMACAGYRFDPSRGRNSATSDICSDLDKLGIHLDDETILARLREAAELLPREANEGEAP